MCSGCATNSFPTPPDHNLPPAESLSEPGMPGRVYEPMSFGLIRRPNSARGPAGRPGRAARQLCHPEQDAAGQGGAMDLVSGEKRVIVAMQHTAKGKSKLVKKCTLPVTALRQVDLVVKPRPDLARRGQSRIDSRALCRLPRAHVPACRGPGRYGCRGPGPVLAKSSAVRRTLPRPARPADCAPPDNKEISVRQSPEPPARRCPIASGCDPSRRATSRGTLSPCPTHRGTCD
jgi:hypothetical protein